MRRFIFPLFVLLAALGVWFASPRSAGERPWDWPWQAKRPADVSAVSSDPRLATMSSAAPAKATPAAAATAAVTTEEFPLAAPLNAPNSNVDGDLDALRQILEAWRSNFPRDGNPIGDNHEISAALTGTNRLGLTLIPKNHRALNNRGELCDRWGTPYRFHQISGDRMELRSAGSDRKFGTDDDAVWSPPP